MSNYFTHESSYIDQPCKIGNGTKIWHFCHVMAHSEIGENCQIGQNVVVHSHVKIGNRVKIQNNVSLYEGLIVEDDVFLGPSCVFTNIINPRSEVVRKSLYEPTRIGRGASIGANATILCGINIGAYAFVGAGAVVTNDVPDFALMVGVPARFKGWISRHGIPLKLTREGEEETCPESGLRYRLTPKGLVCLDLENSSPLPPELSKGQQTLREIKAQQ